MSDDRKAKRVEGKGPASPALTDLPRELSAEEEVSLREEAGKLSQWASRQLRDADDNQGE